LGKEEETLKPIGPQDSGHNCTKPKIKSQQGTLHVLLVKTFRAATKKVTGKGSRKTKKRIGEIFNTFERTENRKSIRTRGGVFSRGRWEELYQGKHWPMAKAKRGKEQEKQSKVKHPLTQT